MARCLHRKKMPQILLKLDILKAFYSVSWSFLLEIPQRLGFGQKWCNIICLLLSTSSTRVLVNGEPGMSLLHHCGLRQGGPLSPMLFILVIMVKLSSIFCKIEGLWLHQKSYLYYCTKKQMYWNLEVISLEETCTV